ncbi:hypothetical protein QJ857_gp0056 [Tupanvirus soda lake]|uniref:DUF2828 domain-containing protein n=2 Tax=Tupanvirus TaxID=2094720 RepID=A0A6N1NUJ8_9VIRU|nr:hypothetical protein QJ857_gp0056 [Tupanvirus soda lake]QKU35967.1 hypothetical protein [Tupanvirus soda lake]
MDCNTCFTENGDRAFSTTGSANLDFFTRITRNAPIPDFIDAFTKAWKENKETAFKLVMNMRDVRGGKGEKLIPAVIMVHLKHNVEPEVYEAILRKLVEYGYWKDLLRIIEIEARLAQETNKKAVADPHSIEVKLFAQQLKMDAQDIDAAVSSSGKKTAISLCGKWAPSEKTHYNHHPMYAAKSIMNELGLTPKEYRQLLTKLRKHLGVLEMLMSTQQYDKIDFSKIPSVAMMKMKHAFCRDGNAEGKESESRKKLHESYAEYLQKLAQGKTKVNVKGIQPHELVSTYLGRGNPDVDLLVEAQWKAVMELVTASGAFRNVTAIVDVSGSMHGQPMEVAIALGILVAMCTTGPFHGQVITFEENPTWHRLLGSNLMEQVNCLKNAPWGGSTNLRAVFDMILLQAVSARLTKEEMVKTLFIFTDMQFNSCDRGNWQSTFEYAKAAFAEKGYELPRIVCWNLRTSSSKSLPVTQDTEGYAMLSGFSAELLKCILNAQEFTPYAMMMHVLEPYAVPTEVSCCAVDELVVVPNLEAAVGKSAIKKAFKNPTSALMPSSRMNFSDSDSDSESSTESD